MSSYSLHSLKGDYSGDHIGDYERFIQGDTKSLDYSSYSGFHFLDPPGGLGSSFCSVRPEP